MVRTASYVSCLAPVASPGQLLNTEHGTRNTQYASLLTPQSQHPEAAHAARVDQVHDGGAGGEVVLGGDPRAPLHRDQDLADAGVGQEVGLGGQVEHSQPVVPRRVHKGGEVHVRGQVLLAGGAVRVVVHRMPRVGLERAVAPLRPVQLGGRVAIVDHQHV